MKALLKAMNVGALTLAVAANAFAADFASQYKDAFDDFTKRGADVKFAESCADKAATAVTLATSDVEKFDAFVLQSRCIYYVGVKAKTDDEKIMLHGQGKNLANRAKNLQPERAEGYYFFGINLGRWAEANGIMKSLRERHNLRNAMETMIKKTAIVDGKTIPGKEYDSYGGYRTLGRMYFKLPGMFDGDNKKAEDLLREALVESEKMGVRNALNVQYFAEVLVARNKKAEARQVLDAALRFESNPEGYNPARIPETIDEMRAIRALRNELGD